MSARLTRSTEGHPGPAVLSTPEVLTGPAAARVRTTPGRRRSPRRASGRVGGRTRGRRTGLLLWSAAPWEQLRSRLNAVRAAGAEAGMATAEYAIATLAAVGFAGLLLVILRGDEVRGMLTALVRQALQQ
ncbi:DUF4244 domain-containing protein [Cellulomonas soli]|uniref:DUF4244 domain-containing protein n=1 Tax=Cellulomonas soli TaxID=931535 RepID=A0A512PGH8_9CELL|nr:DUF4244 domain-containing protein [Cellulomonas soli]NYI58128.1 hypothetical protein [Cellulomonas soli]GEP70262.1 hypothetical protein CSO01_29770 [Cellulomonas soli]